MSPEQYPTLFKKAPAGITTPPPQRGEGESEILLPIHNVKEDFTTSTVIDRALAEKLGRDALLKMKAMEFTMKFLAGRPLNKEALDMYYDLIYNKIKNGPTKTRSQIR